MIDKNLAIAIADIACFLEHSDGSIVNPDAALSAMEQMAFRLNLINYGDKKNLIKKFSEISVLYGDRSNFVENLPQYLGLD